MRLLASARQSAAPITATSYDRHGLIDGLATRRRHSSLPYTMLAVLTLLPGCATTPAVQGSRLSSYEGLPPSDGKVTKSKLMVRKEQVLAAKTINIAPTAFPAAISPKLSGEQRALVSNTIDRALCISLSDRFRVVLPTESADLTVRATVTKATETDEIAAGVSAVGSLSTSFIDMGTSVPIPMPRIPYGLGDLSIEAEATDGAGRQQAAMLWGRGAGVFFSSPRASKASDVYELASAFGDDFGHLLVKGETPFKSMAINIPSWQKINSNVGLAPKYAACEAYGRAPGLVGMAGAKIGLPPEWTDTGAKTAVQP